MIRGSKIMNEKRFFAILLNDDGEHMFVGSFNEIAECKNYIRSYSYIPCYEIVSTYTNKIIESGLTYDC
jgi:hypothetical protein